MHNRVADQLNRDVFDSTSIRFGHRFQTAAAQCDLLRLAARDTNSEIFECTFQSRAALAAVARTRSGCRGFCNRGVALSGKPLIDLRRFHLTTGGATSCDRLVQVDES